MIEETGYLRERFLPRFRCDACDYDLCDTCFHRRGGVIAARGICPKRHLLRRINKEPFGNRWWCNGVQGGGEIAAASAGQICGYRRLKLSSNCGEDEEVDPSRHIAQEEGCWKQNWAASMPAGQGEIWGCDLCDFHVCGFCHFNYFGVHLGGFAINDAGHLATLALNGKYYCENEDFQCGCCSTGKCGPESGCSCIRCLALELQLGRRNRDGILAERRIENGGYFCKRRLADGSICGPLESDRGAATGACGACRELTLQQPVTNRDGATSTLTGSLHREYRCAKCAELPEQCGACARMDHDVIEATTLQAFHPKLNQKNGT